MKEMKIELEKYEKCVVPCDLQQKSFSLKSNNGHRFKISKKTLFYHLVGKNTCYFRYRKDHMRSDIYDG